MGLTFSASHLTPPELLAGAIGLVSSAILFINVRDDELGTPTLMVGGIADAIFIARLALLGGGLSQPRAVAAKPSDGKRGRRMNRYQAISEQFYGNRLLFGDAADAGMVAVELVRAPKSKCSNGASVRRLRDSPRAAAAQTVRADRGARPDERISRRA